MCGGEGDSRSGEAVRRTGPPGVPPTENGQQGAAGGSHRGHLEVCHQPGKRDPLPGAEGNRTAGGTTERPARGGGANTFHYDQYSILFFFNYFLNYR